MNNKSVSKLKSFLHSEGISISTGLTKENVIILSHTAQTLQDDQDCQTCSTWKKILEKLDKICLNKILFT